MLRDVSATENRRGFVDSDRERPWLELCRAARVRTVGTMVVLLQSILLYQVRDVRRADSVDLAMLALNPPSAFEEIVAQSLV